MAFPEGPLVSPLFSSHTVDSVHDKLIRSAPAWLNLDGATRTLYGTPRGSDQGPTDFGISANGGQGFADMLCTLVIVDFGSPELQGNISQALSAAGALAGPTTLVLHPGDSFSIDFDTGLFQDNNGHVLTYYATSSDRTPLPAWVKFNSAALSFSGRAPALTSASQSFGIFLIASDVVGFAGAVASFTLQISDDKLAFVPQEEVLNITRAAAKWSHRSSEADSVCNSGTASLAISGQPDSSPDRNSTSQLQDPRGQHHCD
ncbi:polarity establishment/cellular polarization [Zalaria obscura]|uniref:Polarity establishment/cellular polarization n=1 Tax=Zalaria obscura TaxID=2024903 RepID=A0ACC3SI66_9PEZI